MFKLLIKNSIYNLLGLGLPLLVAIYAIPVLIQQLGVDQFGILTMIWAIVSYFGLFDFGLGRALTQKLSFYIGSNQSDRISPLVVTTIVFLSITGVLAGVILLLSAPLFYKIETKVSESLLFSTLSAMSIAMPAVILTACFRGILESLGKFKIINIIRLPTGIFTFVGPLASIYFFGPEISSVAWVLVIGRYISLLAHIIYANKYIKLNYYFNNISMTELNLLLRLGGWMTISNIVSPLMSYIDRFLIGASISTASVSYYVTPQELLTKLAIIPTSVTSVLFPSLAENIENKTKKYQLYYKSILGIVFIVLPLTIIIFLFSKEILTLWINEDFSNNSFEILQILSVGMLFTCVAQVPFTLIQSQGYAQYTAKLHLIEFPIYVLLIFIAAESWGAVGVAVAWSLRNFIDTILLFYLERKIR